MRLPVGVWVEPPDPGKYAINPFTHKVECVPTANVVLNWATGKTEAHQLDKNLSTIKVRSSDGFTFNLDVSQIIHIPRNEAPKVIARFGNMSRQAVAGESLERAAVAGWNGHEVVDREAGVVPGEEKAGAVVVEQTGPLEQADDLVPEQLLGGRGADVRHAHPLAGGGPAAAGDERVYVRELRGELLSAGKAAPSPDAPVRSARAGRGHGIGRPSQSPCSAPGFFSHAATAASISSSLAPGCRRDQFCRTMASANE